jgi:hypothetical protein
MVKFLELSLPFSVEWKKCKNTVTWCTTFSPLGEIDATIVKLNVFTAALDAQ